MAESRDTISWLRAHVPNNQQQGSTVEALVSGQRTPSGRAKAVCSLSWPLKSTVLVSGSFVQFS